MKNQKSKIKNIVKSKYFIFGLCFLSLVSYFLFSINFAEAQNKLPIFNGTALPKAGSTAGGAAVAGQFAKAIGGKALDAASWGLMIYGILNLLQYVLWWLISYGYTLLTAAVNMALDPSWFQIDAVLNGWRLVRDFANIWFILTLLFIAIGTILRAQSYQAKKLLPTLIMVAIIINFSLPITGFIIDISNVISFQFLKSICPEVKNGEHCDFSANLENALDTKGFSQSLANPQSLIGTTTPVGGTENETGLLGTQKAQAVVPIAIAAGVWKAIQIAGIVGVAWDLGSSLFAQSSPLGGVAIGPFVSIVVTNIFLLLTAFVIISLALLFLIRIASLLFLTILSPIGFVASIIPATQKYAGEWWNKLFTQSFFAPFSLFFLWISLSLMGNIKDALTASGVSYDFTSPANARIIFYIFSLILLYGSIWIAKKMGAFGAEAVIKWWGSIQKGLTGLAGGLAGRLLVAPIGAAALGAGIPQAIGRISPLAGTKAKEFTEYLSKRGKAPEAAEAKAALGMQLAPAERAGYFAKLDRAAKEAMLRKMKAEERESIISSLSAGEAEAARQILRSATFTPEEKAKSEVEEFQRRTAPEQWAAFGSLSEDAQQDFLMRFTDDDRRAEFIGKVKEKNPDAANNANQFLEKNARFTAGQQFGYAKARMKQELISAEKTNQLLDFLEKYSDDDQKKYFGAMDDRQRLVLLEGWQGNDIELNKLRNWVLDMKPEDKDKFYRETLGKRASPVAMENLINLLPETEQSKVISAASPQQLAQLAYRWKDDAQKRNRIEQHIADHLSQNQQKDYNNTLERLEKRGGTPPPTPPMPSSPTGGTGPTKSTPPALPIFPKIETEDDAIDSARYFDSIIEKDETEEIEKAVEEIQSKPPEQQIEIIRYFNPIQKIQYIEKISPSQTEKFETALVEDIKRTERIDFNTQIYMHPQILGNPVYQRAFLRGSDIQKLVTLIREYPSANGFIKDELMKNMPTEDPELHAQAVAEKFEKEFKNQELGIIFSDIIRTQKENLSPVGKELREAILGPEF